MDVFGSAGRGLNRRRYRTVTTEFFAFIENVIVEKIKKMWFNGNDEKIKSTLTRNSKQLEKRKDDGKRCHKKEKSEK